MCTCMVEERGSQVISTTLRPQSRCCPFPFSLSPSPSPVLIYGGEAVIFFMDGSSRRIAEAKLAQDTVPGGGNRHQSFPRPRSAPQVHGLQVGRGITAMRGVENIAAAASVAAAAFLRIPNRLSPLNPRWDPSLPPGLSLFPGLVSTRSPMHILAICAPLRPLRRPTSDPASVLKAEEHTAKEMPSSAHSKRGDPLIFCGRGL